MSDTERAILIALYAAITAALTLPLSEGTRRSLSGARCQLARDLGIPVNGL